MAPFLGLYFVVHLNVLYGIGSLLLGAYLLWHAFRFWREPGDSHARKLLVACYLYLPAILLILLLGKW